MSSDTTSTDATRLKLGERISSKGKMLRVSELDIDSVQVMRPVLVMVAEARKTITYGQLKAKAALPHTPPGMGRLLDLTKLDCDRRGEPDLAALVVNATTHEVGDMYGTGANDERDRVYASWTKR